MTYQIAILLMTLSDLRDYLSFTRLFKDKSVPLCSSWEHFNWYRPSHGSCATFEFLV